MNTKKIFIGLVLFIILMIVGGIWFWQKNVFSSSVVEIEINAPEEVVLGEEVTYELNYKNTGEVVLENVELRFEYPEGSVPIEEESRSLVQRLDPLGPGEEGSFSFMARLFGKEGDQRTARATISFRPRDLSATYRSETSFSTEISSVPLTFEIDAPSRVEGGQTFQFNINYFSQTDYPLSDIRVKLEYPDGFSSLESTPAQLGNNEWQIATLQKTEGGRISVRGTLDGEYDQSKFLRATFGIWKNGEFTLLRETERQIQLVRPRLFITQRVNGFPEYSASPGEELHYEVTFKNISDKTLENLDLRVDLEGRPFDFTSIRTSQGEFREGTSTITWDPEEFEPLQSLEPGEEGRVEFWIHVRPEWQIFSSDKNFTLQSTVLLSDIRTEFRIPIKAGVTIEQEGYFNEKTFSNSGPLPPQVGESTTYTIIWQAENSYNASRNVKVRATLPEYVELTGNVAPSNASITFDSESREIVWSVGPLPAGAGEFTTAPSVGFQIRFTPTDSQRNQTPTLINSVEITGEDTVTEETVRSSDGSVDTTLPDDPSISGQDGRVQ